MLPLTFSTVARSLVITAVTVFISTKANAQGILLQGAMVHTVSGQTITNGDVFVQNGKVVQVFNADAPERKLLPTNTTVVDLKGLHLYPGLIALNTSLGLSEIGGVRSTRDNAESGEYTPDVQSWIAVNPDSELIPVARANGVTHIEPAPSGGSVAGQSGIVALDGWTTEQMTIKKPVGLHVYWPEMDLNTTPKEEFKDQSKWKSLEDQSKERQKKLKALADFFDDARAYAKAKEAGKDTDFKNVPSWDAMVPFVRGDLPLMIHADEVRQIKSATEWATTNHYKMVLVGGRDAWMLAASLATNKVPVLYETVFNLPPRDTDAYDVSFKAAAILQKAGVQVSIGMGASTFDSALIKNLPYQAAQSMAFGFPKDEALKSITLYPAQLAGVADKLGSIEAGKDATLFASDGDILDIRSNVKKVWIAGKEMSLENRHTRLYQKYKNRPVAK